MAMPNISGAFPKGAVRIPENLPEYLKETWQKISTFVGDRMKETTDEAQHMMEKAMGEHAIKDIRDPKIIGLALALSSSAFIGASFVLTRIALQRASSKGGASARSGGFSYVKEPLWWLAMGTMLFGELANFSAYAYAPAVLVTPLGAISIITTALLADCVLGERLHAVGMAGCFFCIAGSMILVSASPQEQMLTSVEEIWSMATQPTFVAYVIFALLIVAVLIIWGSPRYGESQILVYVCICSLMGSLSVVSCKALGIAIKLTFRGANQLVKPETCAAAHTHTPTLARATPLRRPHPRHAKSAACDELQMLTGRVSPPFIVPAHASRAASAHMRLPLAESPACRNVSVTFSVRVTSLSSRAAGTPSLRASLCALQRS